MVRKEGKGVDGDGVGAAEAGGHGGRLRLRRAGALP